MDATTFKEITAPLVAITGIRYVDLDLGQLEAEDPPVSFPCFLVGLGGGDVFNLGNGVDQVELNFTVRVAFKLYERTASITAKTYRDAALAHLDKLALIHAALNGLAGTNFNAIARTAYWSNERRADIRVYSAAYGTLLEDDGTGGDTQYVPWADVMPAAPELCLEEDIFPDGI